MITELVFLWLISIRIILYRSIHIVANGRILFFFVANIPLYIFSLIQLEFLLLLLWILYLVNYLFHYLCFSLALSMETNSSIFSFCLTVSVSMILGETATYCCLEGVSLCGSIPIQPVCPVVLVGELDLTWTQVMSFLRVCWQLSLWKDVGLEKEGLRPEPGESWGFLSAQGLSPPYWGQGQVPSCWSRSPKDWVWASSST